MRPIFIFGLLETVTAIEAPREFVKFDALFAAVNDVCETKTTCNVERLSLVTGLPADFDPESLNKVEREKRARMYKKPDEPEDKTNSTVELYKLLEDIIDQRVENGQPEIPDFPKNPPVLKGYKTLPKYSKFLARTMPNINLKSASKPSRSGPTVDRLGDGPMKTAWIIEHIVNERGVYYLQEKPHDEKGGFQLNFFTKPTGKFTDVIYICELTRDLKRWAIMRRPCTPEKGINFGYKAYVSFSGVSGSKPAQVANNRAVGMPFGTRISTEPLCCKGSKFKGFEPCCHYRHDPFVVFLPVGWSKWSQWSTCTKTCDSGTRQRSRKCNGDCGGPSDEVQACETIPCNPTGWAEWTMWGDCSKTCGGGVQFRERTCADICPQNRNFHKEPRNCNVFHCMAKNIWGEWNSWSKCSATCEVGRTYRKRPCDGGPCLEHTTMQAPAEMKDCFDKFCNDWSDWGEWSPCSKECNTGNRERRRKCINGVAGLQGCPGSDFDDTPCNTEECVGEAEDELNAWGVKKHFSHHTLNLFQQECLDFHNFFRALHNLAPLRWDPALWETSKLWSKKLISAAPKSPSITNFRTKNWPHSDVGTAFRPNDVGENIAWDLSPSGSTCAEAVFRWYSELFYYNPNNQQSRRRGEPVGHVTQLLWKTTTAVGCSRTQKAIKQPANVQPRYQKSTYTVCHYSPQGNIIGLMDKNWQPKDDAYCSTYNSGTGKNMCGKFGTCQGLESGSKCGCKRRSTGKVVPLCMGRCLIECYNQWGTPNYYPNECVGKKYCTCGKKGAFCV